MDDRDDVMTQIRRAFERTPSPGAPFLAGSREGSEAEEIAGAFAPFTRWDQPDAALLDQQYAALSLLSEGGFRFFLPAYLIADLQDRLSTADPVFHLTHGFSDRSVWLEYGEQRFKRPGGKIALVNPRRYGAMTFFDYARFRLSVFCREEARAIVAYLRLKMGADPTGGERDEIAAALEGFWLDRAAHAPDHDALAAHLEQEAEEFAAIRTHRRRTPDAGGS